MALVEGRPRLATLSLRALAVGFPVAIAAAGFLTLLLLETGIGPEHLGNPSERELTQFISHPNWYSAIVALMAGVVGMLALVGAKSGALIGVLISVTTIPAAANVGVGVAYGNWSEPRGAGAQLVINVAAILASGLAVLLVARLARSNRQAKRRG